MQQAELIIAYLNRELREPQLQEFEQRLNDEPEFKAAVRDYQVILEGLKSMGHEATLEEISKWKTEEEGEEEDSQLVSAYIADSMDKTARAEFERRMAEEPSLKEAVADQEIVVAGFKGMQHEAFSEEVAVWAKELPGNPQQPTEAKTVKLKRSVRLRRYSAAAAILLLLIAAFWWLDLGGNRFSADEFRAENYIAPIALGDRGDAEAELEAASRDVSAGRYAEAVEKLRVIGTDDALYVKARFWLGHAYYRLNNYEAAVEAFTQSLEPPVNTQQYDLAGFDHDNAAWTRILAQLARLKDADRARRRQDLDYFLVSFLEKADRADSYYKKALQLQEAIGGN